MIIIAGKIIIKEKRTRKASLKTLSFKKKKREEKKRKEKKRGGSQSELLDLFRGMTITKERLLEISSH